MFQETSPTWEAFLLVGKSQRINNKIFQTHLITLIYQYFFVCPILKDLNDDYIPFQSRVGKGSHYAFPLIFQCFMLLSKVFAFHFTHFFLSILKSKICECNFFLFLYSQLFFKYATFSLSKFVTCLKDCAYLDIFLLNWRGNIISSTNCT